MNFQNKHVLVTGGAGFIGSTLVRKLVEEKANVIVYDNFITGDISNIIEIKEEIEIIKGDILNPRFKDILINNDVEYVFHLAAEPYIPECYDRPKKFFEVNANGTLNVLLECKEAGVKRILHYSSSEVYGTAKYVPMDENHLTLPLSTYATSKLAADRICFTLFHEQEVPVIILRQFNTYGPRETHPYIIPELISQLSKTNKLRLGNIKAKRDLTYVEDAVDAAVRLMKCKKALGEVFNCGYGKSWSVEELAHIIASLMNNNHIKISIEKERLRPLDVQNLVCDWHKIYKFTGWKPKTSLEDGLQKTIQWFRENGGKWLWEYKIAPENIIWKRKT
jgi:nucleoside-diphosphate-sugar epimerase